MNEKLKHLNNEQVNEIVKKYLNNYKVKDIIMEYNLNVSPRKLKDILPLISIKKQCVYCDYNYIMRVSRNKNELAWCPRCNHKNYEDPDSGCTYCTCDKCRKRRKDVEEKKRRLIKELYGKRKERFCFYDLSLQSQIEIIEVIQENRSQNFKELYPIEDAILSKSKDELIPLYHNLIRDSIISVSTKSPFLAFEKDDFPRSIFISRAAFDINVDFTKESIEKIKNHTFFSASKNPNELIIIWKLYIYNDVIDRFQDMMEKRGLKIQITEKNSESLQNLVNHQSYTQLITLCYRAARYYSDLVVTNKISKYEASIRSLPGVIKNYEYLKKKSWETSHSKSEYAGKKLKNFVYNILGKDLRILEGIPSVDLLENTKNHEIINNSCKIVRNSNKYRYEDE